VTPRTAGTAGAIPRDPFVALDIVRFFARIDMMM